MSHTIIIGGGIAGLTAATYFHRAGKTFTLLEAESELGGRMRTDEKEGYLLDRGFQVLLTAYPEAQKILDYDKLQLRKFLPGALMFQEGGKTSRVGDPRRDLSSLIPTMTANVGTIKDKLTILNLQKSLAKHSIEELFNRHEVSTATILKDVYGFSDQMIATFFEPFFSGIFLERGLKASRRMFDFVFKMFGEGFAAIPAKGMGEIPKQLAAALPEESIKLDTKVTGINGHFVNATGGDVYQGDQIIIATEATGFVRELDNPPNKDYVSTTHIHFSAAKAPIEQPLIGLVTSAERLVNNLTTISKVAPAYKGENERELISVSIIGRPELKGDALLTAVRNELRPWLGNQPEEWQHIQSHTVKYALPVQHRVRQSELVRANYYTFIIGDHSSNGSINEAMRSGRMAAEAIISGK